MDKGGTLTNRQNDKKIADIARDVTLEIFHRESVSVKKRRKRTYEHIGLRRIQGLEDYMKKRREKFNVATSKIDDCIIKKQRENKTTKEKWEPKSVYVCYKKQNGEIANKKLWTINRNLERETEYILLAVRNNATRSNYIEAKIDNMQ